MKALGGLHIIGTERHEARRIDLQLRGRCGRQGDPGSQPLLSVAGRRPDADLRRRMGEKRAHPAGHARRARRSKAGWCRAASKAPRRKVEERNFDIRKNLLEYDEVMDEQRKRVYRYRQRILDGGNCKELILEMIDKQIDQNLDVFLDKDYGTETFAKWAGSLLSVELDARDFRGLDFETAQRQAKDEAERMAESQIFDAIEENLPADDEARLELGGPGQVRQHALETQPARSRPEESRPRRRYRSAAGTGPRRRSNRSICAEGARFLDADHGIRTACGWVQYKFGLQIDPSRSSRIGTGAVQGTAAHQSPPGLRRERSRISGAGRVPALHHRRFVGPKALRPRATGRLGARALRRRTRFRTI